jgi:flagellar basal body-associated protein FliL
MAEDSIAKSKLGSHHRLFLPLMIGSCISLVLVLFVIGYMTLTTPEPRPDDIYTIMKNAKAKADADKAGAGNGDDVAPAVPEDATMLPDGTFDFARYSYYSFPLPFVANLSNGKGLLTVEIAIATYGNTLASEKVMKQLETFNPKMRSAINFKLSDQTLDDVNTVAKRNKLAKALLNEVRLVVDGQTPTGPSAITDLHFIKFVLSGT